MKDRRIGLLRISPELIMELLDIENATYIAGTYDMETDSFLLKVRSNDLPEVPDGAHYPILTVEKRRNRVRI